ncbi:hypothetical protein EIP91_003838 [Steccherinum ochraceum]|uniref:cystathionine gamma-synthase n=1 Tax=Steccherinum ochraceum TaxID=92696 RepID=A0A4R0RCC8_9APHY|nr:hypothetical protein EIP91_003838 [Steccherinum ochraceum]
MSSTTTTSTMGSSVPAFTSHAISVSLPTWKDTVAYEEGDKRVLDAMVTGYPRFFIHRSIQKLAGICEHKFGTSEEKCILFPTRKIAEGCRAFMVNRSSLVGSPVPVRLVQYLIGSDHPPASSTTATTSTQIELHIVLFPAASFPFAKQYWQHTGLGVSSRLADRCLSMIPDEPRAPSPTAVRKPTKPSNRHYSARSISSPASPQASSRPQDDDDLDAAYLEERYGRNLPIESAALAKRAMRRRIAGVLVRDSPSDWAEVGKQGIELGPSTRGIKEVTEDDVFLYPTGMAAIYSAHQLAQTTRPPGKSICFGFPYTDTLKILEKWGPGCHFLGHGLDSDIDELERILISEEGKIVALFTEFPSNPLLRCADLPRLRALADKHGFLIVVDETIGNFVNVEILPFADVVVSSLSKVFSGDANVMGGSLVLNPKGQHYAALKSQLAQSYEDSYFAEDAIFMERNSRDFRSRIRKIDQNTEAVCDFLSSHKAPQSATSSGIVKEIFYPKFTTPQHFSRCQTSDEAGYGGLFSITFVSPDAARAFFDALPCAKGPSLGTNFTLACPYTILGHYMELEWAAKYGVEEGLVRVSVGMEETSVLLEQFREALEAAKKVAGVVEKK